MVESIYRPQSVWPATGWVVFSWENISLRGRIGFARVRLGGDEQGEEGENNGGSKHGRMSGLPIKADFFAPGYQPTRIFLQKSAQGIAGGGWLASWLKLSSGFQACCPVYSRLWEVEAGQRWPHRAATGYLGLGTEMSSTV